MKRKSIRAVVLLASLLLLLTSCRQEVGKEVQNAFGQYYMNPGAANLVIDGVETAGDTEYTVAYKTIRKADYLDKTLAGLIAQPAGVLTGNEFIYKQPGLPYLGMPDSWFDLVNGPYAGNFTNYRPGDWEKYTRLFANGAQGAAYSRVGGDDDYHVDIFNQLILKEYGPLATSANIRDMWVKHDVHDWGGGMDARQLFGQSLLSAFSGKREYGNRFHWCTEPYIENETVGMNAPGMGYTAYVLADTFGSVSGDFDSLTWAKFWATIYSGAYFADDVTALLKESAAVLPSGGWNRQIFDLAFALYEKHPDDWRTAVAELETNRRHYAGIDNIQTSVDINNGFTILALLYGKGDWTQTCKVASLSGYDAECTAAVSCGVIGIMKGMDGTPEKVKNVVYNNGKGVYVNDTKTGFVPCIGKDYPEEQTWLDIAKLYQANTEKMIVAYGGKVEDDRYLIPVQKPYAVKTAIKGNAGFEQGDLSGWSKAGDNILVSANDDAHSGNYKGMIYKTGNRLFMRYQNLTVGKTYRVTAYVRTSADVEARLFASCGGQESGAAVCNTPSYWVSRSFSFTAAASSADIGLAMTSGEGWAALDDLSLEEDVQRVLARYEGEDALLDGLSAVKADTAFGGGATSFAKGSAAFRGITLNQGRELYARLYYANSASGMAPLKVLVNGKLYTEFRIPATGTDGAYGCNYVEIPVYLEKGENEIQFQVEGTISVDRPEITTKAPYVF